ncbi:MAG: 3-deoxy-D-manno-octulosonic acid transferase [Planctomyces sp.]|nr:3-deoxy-D-manno-octulosonic acid transferase [Planctomyces sp.]
MNTLDALYAIGAVALAPLWLRKARGGWPERLGRTPALPRADPARPRVLLHGVSVGETAALRELVPMLAHSAEVVVSATTDTGLGRARQLHGGAASVVRYPLDFSGCVRRFLDAVRPSAVALAELEVWPNFIAECHRRAIPVAVINGRLSARSFGGYRRLRAVLGPTFARLARVGAQDADYARRFVAMGTPEGRVEVTGSMKWDAAVIADDAPGSRDLAQRLGIDAARPLVVGGSTGPGEEAALHAACARVGPGVQLLCAPRKPERFARAAAALPGCVRRSQRPAGGQAAGAPSPTGRYLLDTIGELRAAYALADAVFVGRSLTPLGGSDPIEPVGLGRATLIGPHVDNFASVVGELARAGGLRVVSRDGLAPALAQLLADPAARGAMAKAGRGAICAQRGATERHAAMILALLKPPPPSAGALPVAAPPTEPPALGQH